MFARYASYHHCTVFAGSDATKLPTAPLVVPRLVLKYDQLQLATRCRRTLRTAEETMLLPWSRTVDASR
jgi:hypothetical protein